MAELTQFVPLRLVIPGWPTTIVAIPPLIDYVGLADFTTASSGSASISGSGTLQIIDEIEMDLPLIPGMSLAFLNNGDFTELGFDIDYQPELFNVALKSLSAAVRFQSGLLKRMEAIANRYQEAPPDPETGNPLPVEVALDGVDLSLNSDGEFTVGFEGGAPALTIQPFMIGNSGVIVDITSLQLILSAETAATMPASIAPDWRGIYLDHATIVLPEGLTDILPHSISFNDAFIGSGGFSGSVLLDLTNTVKDYDEANAKTLLGFGFTFSGIDLEFKQNSLTRSSITGFLKVPFFDEAVAVEVGLSDDGDFTVALSDTDGLLELRKDGVISIEVSSLEFIKEDEVFSVKLSGKITPLLAGFSWPSFELKGLTISSDGTVKVDGGWIELPDQKALDFHGFKIEIAKLGFGSDEVENQLYKWIGFSGGIQIVENLPLRGGVEGLKVMWTEQGDVKLKIGGVYLSFEIPDLLTFEGSVYFIDEPDKKEFRGGVDLSLIPINFGVDAQFITGRTNDYNYFYIAVGVDLPVGIPLGPPVLGLYGLAGLYGNNMNLDYQKLIDYEDVSQRPDLTDVGNWFNQKDAMAFGAGLTVGTFPDSKFTVKAKALFVVLVPGPVIMIEGNAGMLSIGENYPLHVLAVLDVASGSFLMNISATYEFPKNDGTLLDVSGSAEAFFSAADPGGWHLYLGENKPESKRIRADLLKFFKAQTYLMVDNDGLLMGAWIGYGLDKKYGILHVVLEAWLSGELGLSWMPLQAKGSVTLYGNAELSVSIASLGLSVEANVTAEAPKPLYIAGSLKVQLKTPLGKPKATIKLKWEASGEPHYPIPLSSILGIQHQKVSKNWELTKYSKYDLDDDKLYNEKELTNVQIPSVPVVPPDVLLILNFDKPVQDTGLIGNNPAPASTEKVGDYEFKYELNSVTLDYRDSWNETTEDNNWHNYEDYAESQVQDGQSAFSLCGSWQAMPSTDKLVNTKLILNTNTPFEISRSLDDNDSWLSMISIYNPEYPCTDAGEEEKLCTDFEDRDPGNYYNAMVQDDYVISSPFPMNVHSHNATWLGTMKAMNNGDSYTTVECLQIRSQAETAQINLKVIEKVVIGAAAGLDAYLKLTDEYSGDEVELFINNLEQASQVIPALISFPEKDFPDLPYQVWITCIVDDEDGPFLTAFDKDNHIVDTAAFSSGIKINGAKVFTVKSDSVPIRKIAVFGKTVRIIEICYLKYHRLESSTILVTMPGDMAQGEVYLSKNSNGKIYVYDKDQKQIEEKVFNIAATIADNQMQPILLQEVASVFRSFLITGQFKLIRVCGVTKEAHDTYTYNSGINTHLQTSLEENWGRHTAQLLHPNKYYRLKIETSTSRRKGNNEWEEQPFTEYLYFKTGNPPGPAAATQTSETDQERYDLDGTLVDLTPYINYTIPLGGTPDMPQQLAYRSYDVGIVYNDSYIDQMYQMANLPLSVKFIDNNNLPVLNSQGEEIQLNNLWGDNTELSLDKTESQYEDMIDESGCIVISTTVHTEHSNELIGSSRDLLFKPQTQYRARLIAGEQQSVYEFSFFTSRYSNFLHHIQSFANIIWNHFDLLNDPNYAVDSTVVDQILANAETDPVKFEQLMNLFDLNPRQLPERLEVALISDKNKQYGLLVETPEPFDWQRCSCSLLYGNKSEVISEFNGTLKITGGSVQPVGVGAQKDENKQWVEILVLETTDLSDYAIEYQALPLNETATWKEYFRFAPGSKFNAGTCIRIFNGATPTGPATSEQVNLYAAHTGDTFTTAGAMIRIKGTNDEIPHTQPIYSKGTFKELTTNIIINEDGSRFFIFIENGTKRYSNLNNGIYSLKFTYKRDIGTTAPVLKRFGFTEAEETVINFSS